MGEKIKKHPVAACWILFAILILVHGFEAIVLRMDETVLGENFINKLFGIFAIFIVLRILKWKWSDIGFNKSRIIKNIGLGLLLAVISFALSYTLEIIILKNMRQSVGIGFFTAGFSLTGEAEIHTGFGFILLCIFFNIINVIMEEGAFRGLFNRLSATKHSMRFALLFQALLFGIWHIVTPLHNLIDGDINFGTFALLGISYIILAGLMGIKWGLMYRMTGSLYAGMADHFFNNCIATNLLHVTSEEGIDEMMLVRVIVAQLVSFTFILILWMKKRKSIERKQK